jgi:hypothetical protein
MEKKYQCAHFDRVEVGLAYEFEIIRGDLPGVTVEADEGFFKNVKVDVENGTLKITHSRHIGWAFRLTRPVVKVMLPDIKGLNVSGAASGSMKGFESLGDFALDMKGATSLEAEFKAGKTDVRLRGACRLKVSGSSETVVIDAGGTADIDMEKFTVGNAAVRLAGVSHGTIHVTGRLDVRLNGVSELSWLGEPVMGDIRTTGISTMKKVG